MAIHLLTRVLLSYFFLLTITACGYQRPAGKWVSIDASSLYFSAVELSKDGIDPSYAAVCREARDEINAQLIKKLPAKIAPLILKTTVSTEPSDTTTATLKIILNKCEIDVDQNGGAFHFYLTLPFTVSVTQNQQNILSYNMDSYEQVGTDTPSPDFEFTFAEPVARTLLLFNGDKLWLPND